jgi:hypothetical protein|tara:strand:- start:296 stop:493 length:198 start_codon:yes stop_codon:yes gene_type:complete
MLKFVIVNLKTRNTVDIVGPTDPKLSNPDYYILYKGTDEFDVSNFAHTMKMAYAYSTDSRKNTTV